MAELDVRRGAVDDRPITVLIVDNNSEYRELAVPLLERAGHVVVAVADGEQALAHLRAGVDTRSFVVLTGLQMPRLNGWELLEAIEGEDWKRAVVLVVVTGTHNPGLPVGVWCEQKPVNSERLLGIVRRALPMLSRRTSA